MIVIWELFSGGQTSLDFKCNDQLKYGQMYCLTIVTSCVYTHDFG